MNIKENIEFYISAIFTLIGGFLIFVYEYTENILDLVYGFIFVCCSIKLYYLAYRSKKGYSRK